MKISMLLVTVCLLMVASAQAAPITWTLNIALDDGATATGFFIFDPDLGSDQKITNFSINISAPAPGILKGPFNQGLPTSVFFPFDFTPANSSGIGPFSSQEGAFEFHSNTMFPNPIAGLPPETLVLQFVPFLPLSDTSSTIINNSNIDLNSGHSNECFNCLPYSCFVGATSDICVPRATVPQPPSHALFLIGLVTLIAVVMRRRTICH